MLKPSFFSKADFKIYPADLVYSTVENFRLYYIDSLLFLLSVRKTGA